MNENNQKREDAADPTLEIFCSALERSSVEERTAYLESACADDDDLRETVNRLLGARAESETFFAKSSPARISAAEISRTLADIPEFFENMSNVLPDDDEVGKEIGNYKLLQKIGKGGGGNVYLAEQLRPVRRQVALKIIKRGMDTRSIIARFEAERQALAMMEHPNIAHVLHAGETETGRPFFVMELVHGIRITTYCDENQLDIQHRLELFIQVCHAIQHAHQKGIIHRDIKPSNVLITMHDGVPMPKVIDFGIAKATSGDRLAEETYQTSMEPFLGTPAYMSPEQADAAQMDIDMRSDVYGLGALLYELLCGRPPFEQKELLQAGIDEMRRILRDCEPTRPSVRIQELSPDDLEQTANNRRLSPRHLATLLSNELDWIASKAMEKDREGRYQTVDALAEDVFRYLNHDPIVARPPSRSYRFRKLVRRNKGVFASMTAVSITLLAGLGTSSWLFFKEREARMRAVTAEQKQQQLRMESEDRERITQAAFLISQKELEEADRVVDQVAEVTPSLEAESVLRTLGEWHALNGRWEASSARFSLLLKADIKDNAWTITDDLLLGGPVFVQQDDVQRYKQFRRVAIDMYGNTTSGIFAERTLKFCLMMPADHAMLQSLQPLADLVSAGCQGEMGADGMKAWGGISLALMALRNGDMPLAIEWCERSRTCTDGHPARIAISNIIQAMAAHKAGDVLSAGEQFSQGRALIEPVFSKPLVRGNANNGFWYDWLLARVLMQEAAALMG